MGSVFGSCGDLFVTWEEGLFDANGNSIVRFTSADGESTLDICLDPLKGVTVNGEPVEIVDGVVNIEIAEDLFGSAVVTADTATITFPGQAPFDVCLNPVKTVNGVAPDAAGNVEIVIPEDVLTVLTDNGDNTFTYTDEEGNPVTVDTGSVVDNGDGTSTVTDSEGNAVIVCQNPVKTVNGVAPDAAGNVNVIIPEVPPETVTNQVQDAATGTITYTNEDGTPQTAETKYSTTVPFSTTHHDITTDDGVTTRVCLAPVKSVNGVSPDASGAVTVPQAVVANIDASSGSVTDAQGNTCVFLKQVDIPADVRVIGITTQESADGTQHDIFLQLSDGTQLAAGTLIDDDTFATVIPDNGDGTGTVTDPVGNEIVICLNPVKTVNGVAPDANGNVDVVIPDVPGLVDEDGNPIPMLNGDWQIIHPDPINPPPATVVTSTGGTVDVTATASGYNVEVTHPEQPTALKKDGTAYVAGDTYTPINNDSLTDAGRVISSTLGDKVIGQTATGDCNLFDPVTPCPQVGVSKKFVSADPSPAAVGSVLTWDVNVWNAGCVDLQDVDLTDDIGTLAADNTGPLAPGESFATTSTYTVTGTEADRRVCNTVLASGSDANGQFTVWQDSDVVMLPCEDQIVCGLGPIEVYDMLLSVVTPLEEYVFTDPVTGATVTLEFTGMSGSAITQKTISPTAVSFGFNEVGDNIPVGWSFTSAIPSPLCQTPSGCESEQNRLFPFIVDADVGTLVPSVITVSQSQTSPIFTQGDFVEDPAGTYTPQGTPNTGAGNLGVGDNVQNPAVDGAVFAGDISWAQGDDIAFRVIARSRKAIEAVYDCDGNFVSAIDCNNQAVAEADAPPLA